MIDYGLDPISLDNMIPWQLNWHIDALVEKLKNEREEKERQLLGAQV